MSKRRPLTDDQRIEMLAARWNREKPPDYCPICGEVGLIWCKEEHPCGETYAIEDLGYDCKNCGRIWDCPDCGGWHSQGAEEWGLPADCIPCLCSCPITSASSFDPGTLAS